MALDALDLQLMSNAIVGVGVLVAAGTIAYNIRIAKKTQTANFLFESRKDHDYIAGLKTLTRVHNSGVSFRSYVFPCTDVVLGEEQRQEYSEIQYIINFYERVAVSVKHGIYHEDMLKSASCSTVVRVFETSEPLIKAIREKQGRDTLYQEFEWMVKRWKAKPLKKIK